MWKYQGSGEEGLSIQGHGYGLSLSCPSTMVGHWRRTDTCAESLCATDICAKVFWKFSKLPKIPHEWFSPLGYEQEKSIWLSIQIPEFERHRTKFGNSTVTVDDFRSAARSDWRVFPGDSLSYHLSPSVIQLENSFVEYNRAAEAPRAVWFHIQRTNNFRLMMIE